ncbi:MAG: hypothetical protein ACLGI5_12240 [Thermoleophilia bacterium]
MGDPGRTTRSLSLTTGGITLLGVLLSIGVTLGAAIEASWWVQVLVGVCATIALTVVVKLGSEAGRGPLARLANWVIGGDDDR